MTPRQQRNCLRSSREWWRRKVLSPTRSSVVKRPEFFERKCLVCPTSLRRKPTIGHKPMKDRQTLPFCANTGGDLKNLPLHFYHVENALVFKKYKVLKSKFPVMWWSSRKKSHADFVSRVGQQGVWFDHKGVPGEQRTCKCLLVMGNMTAHPPAIEDNILPEHRFITAAERPTSHC